MSPSVSVLVILSLEKQWERERQIDRQRRSGRGSSFIDLRSPWGCHTGHIGQI